jgi:hypothetical protein
MALRLKIEFANEVLVCSLELLRGLEQAASHIGTNDKLTSRGQFERHVPNLSYSLLTGLLRCGTVGALENINLNDCRDATFRWIA